MSARKIAFYSPKGGVGKTTGVMNAAGILAAKYKASVLIIDADPSANVSSGFSATAETVQAAYPELLTAAMKRNIDIPPKKAPLASIVAAFPEVNPHEHPEKQKARQRIFIAPAQAGEAAASLLIKTEDAIMKHNYGLEMAGKPRDYTHLARLFAPLEDTFDYILIDAPGAIAGAMYLEAVCAADYIVSPAEADIWSPAALSRVIDVTRLASGLSKKEICFLGYYLSKYDARRTRSDVAIKEGIRDKDLLFSTAIPNSSSVKNAQLATDILAFTRPGDEVTKCFERLTDEIVRKIKKIEKQRKG